MRQTLGEVSAACMQMCWKGTAGETTAELNSQAALNFFGATSKLSSITTARVDKYILHLANKANQASTINRKLTVLSKILNFAHKRGEVAVLPVITWQPSPQSRQRWLTDEEEKQVINFFIDRGMMDHLNAMAVLIDTGLRPSELWRVELAHITGNVLLVGKTKENRPRCIPLTRRAALILTSRGECPFPFNNRWMERGWDLAKKAIGLVGDKQFLVYTLRHTCASRLVQRNVPLQVVSQWLGHSSLNTTLRYAHLSVDNLQQAMRVLEHK